jgi:hypothetical protein
LAVMDTTGECPPEDQCKMMMRNLYWDLRADQMTCYAIKRDEVLPPCINLTLMSEMWEFIDSVAGSKPTADAVVKMEVVKAEHLKTPPPQVTHSQQFDVATQNGDVLTQFSDVELVESTQFSDVEIIEVKESKTTKFSCTCDRFNRTKACSHVYRIKMAVGNHGKASSSDSDGDDSVLDSPPPAPTFIKRPLVIRKDKYGHRVKQTTMTQHYTRPGDDEDEK